MIEGQSLCDSIVGARVPAPPPLVAAAADGAHRMSLPEIQAALADAMVETRYQPVVRLADRAVIGLEALARLNHPAHGTVLPEAFVPQIEDAGLATQLTDLVAAATFADMAGAALAPLGLSISLNLPLDVLLLTAALTRLDAQRQAAGIPVERVIIELTESRPVQDIAALRRALERLRQAGYQIMIDDVGPAVAELDLLLELPFTGLKLDKGLVLQLDSNPEVLAEVQHVVARAKARGLSVVAEGIENVAQWHRLHALGVDHAQGFLVARPLPAAAVPVWLQSWQALPDF
jgi:EAL domain-containing protein (putative c-di-GMP-specific phosphodiesterase class I)